MVEAGEGELEGVLYHVDVKVASVVGQFESAAAEAEAVAVGPLAGMLSAEIGSDVL